MRMSSYWSALAGALTAGFVAVSALVPGSLAIAEGSPVAPSGDPAGSRVTIEVLPQMEILAAAISQTSRAAQELGTGGSAYQQALRQYVAPFKDHPAVLLAQSLMEFGFSYDAPPTFALQLGPLPDLELEIDYSDYIIGRAGGGDLGRARLEEFRLALKDLAARSDFAAFLAGWEGAFERWEKAAAADYDGDAVVNWLEDFFGAPQVPTTYRIILSPALFPRGGYGPRIEGSGGASVCEVLTDWGSAAGGDPRFSTGSRSLTTVTLHEWGHSFVNPALTTYASDFRTLTHLYDPVASVMKRQAYGEPMTFFNEQVLRSAVTLAVEDMAGPEAVEDRIARDETAGFYLTRLTVDALREYEAARDAYPTFDRFVPTLVARYSDYSPPRKPGRFAAALVESLVVVGLAVVVFILAWRYGRRARAPEDTSGGDPG